MSFLTTIFGDANARAVKALQPTVDAVNAREKHFEGMNDDHLRSAMAEIRAAVAGDPAKLDDHLVDVFALVREASKRTLGQRHFDVQLMGGMVIHQGKIAEMKTGEGKTLVATLPVTLNAVAGKGVHVVTVNDYLAKRDAVWMGQVYRFLGLSVACLQHEAAFRFEPDPSAPMTDIERHLRPVSRQEAYAADVTYGTNNEFGFDYLRDNMVQELSQCVQRGHHFAIVDEIDSILIDEARTPLIISAPAEQPAERYYQFASIVATLQQDQDFNIDEKLRAATLTQKGIDAVERQLGVANIYDQGGVELVHHLEQALKARTLYLRDRDYVVKDGEIIIVDEFTGRLMHGRRYSEGLHQAIEAKENVKIQQESVTMATVTFQNFFRMYDKLSGMTGTAATEAEEFSKIYHLDVVSVPTNRDMVRRDFGDRVYASERAKYGALIEKVKELRAKGQPVLLGSISIEKNELLSSLLTGAGVAHEILNAKNHEREAAIIAQAGRAGAVTLATNIAGRGVDIILGGTPFDAQESDKVKAAGGLFVLGSERHESRRIDNQLRGRSGRQGDPGASQFFVSFEDDLMRIFGSARMKTMMSRLNLPDDVPIENKLVTRAIESAQQRVEGHNFDIRKHLIEYDDVINKHREVMYRRRRELLEKSAKGERLRGEVEKAIEGEIEQVVSFHTSAEDEHAWDIEEVYNILQTMFPIELKDRLRVEALRDTLAGDKAGDAHAREAIVQHLLKLERSAYDTFEARIGDPQQLAAIEKTVLLRSIDQLWVEHIDNMDHLRRGIGLRGYGQRDPLVEYKKEAYELFQQLQRDIQHQVASTVFRVTAARPSQPQRALTEQSSQQGQSAFDRSQQAPAQVASEPLKDRTPDGQKIGRNDPCWCGAKKPDGTPKKYKHCHGKNSTA